MTCLQTESKSLERNLKDCERVLLFAATLGSQVDVLLHRYNMIQMSKAVVMQAASVAMLETFCDEQNQKLKEEYEKAGICVRGSAPATGIFRWNVSVILRRPWNWASGLCDADGQSAYGPVQISDGSDRREPPAKKLYRAGV